MIHFMRTIISKIGDGFDIQQVPYLAFELMLTLTLEHNSNFNIEQGGDGRSK